MLDLLIRIVVLVAGVVVVAKTLHSAVQVFVLPRGVPDRLSRSVFLAMRKVFDFRARSAGSYVERDRIMAFYAPLSLLSLPVVWISLVLLGYSAIFWALDIRPVSRAVEASGSSLLTLGFAQLGSLPLSLVAFSEAVIGLGLVALLIAYLPTMYGAWSRREQAVALLGVRAGALEPDSPPSPWELIIRFHRLNRLDRMGDLWPQWETWFTDVEESHTTLAALTFFRSPQPQRSWVTAAGIVLDAAALMSSVVDVPRNFEAELCIRAGYMALREIAAFFRIPFNLDPRYPQQGISVTRSEWDAVVNTMEREGVPIKPDREQAWHDFAGWRVNYDTVLLSLAALTMAPYAPWISDRSLRRPGVVQATDAVESLPFSGARPVPRQD